MIPGRGRFLKHLAKLYDLAALVGSFVFASIAGYPSASGLSLARLMALRVTLGNCLLFALLLIVWHNVFVLCGMYRSKRLESPRDELIALCGATTLASGILFLSARMFHISIVKAAFLLIFWATSTCLVILGRGVARPLLLVLRRRGRNSRYLLIIGTNRRAIAFADEIMARPELGYHIVGFVDDAWEGIAQFERTGHSRCCSFPGLTEFLRHNVVDEAAIFLPMGSDYERSARLVSECQQHGIAIRFSAHSFDVRGTQVQAQDLDEHSHVLAITGLSNVWAALIKRTIDCAVCIALLTLAIPFFAVIALLIKMTSKGPVFFRQKRVGLNKRQFNIYKFRTMVADAEQLQNQLLARNEMSGPAFKMKNDPRVTPLGRILRKTSIDELPQLWNVLKGNMSLVGPRAMSLRDYQLFDQDWQRRRFSVKPGITCLWQIYGRNSIPFEEWMRLDMQYIDKWSLWLDLKILIQTVPVVLRGTGAA
jgi:exopolysaccharide biosynthesis polyprenyl glycosylphosphotransferase